MAEIIKYTEYYILTPDWIIEHIQNEMKNRDINGVTGGRLKAISVTGEHPLVQLVAQVVQTGTINPVGLIPAISVTEGDETEEATTIGQGIRSREEITQAWLDNIRSHYSNMEDRVKEGIITDKQLDAIQAAITASPTKKLFRDTNEFFEREEVFVSLWAHSTQERKLIGKVLRSILYEMRLEMGKLGVKDISIRTSKGLTNFNFGKMLYGQETVISFLNGFRNHTIVDDAPRPGNVHVHGAYESAGRNDKNVEIYPVEPAEG